MRRMAPDMNRELTKLITLYLMLVAIITILLSLGFVGVFTSFAAEQAPIGRGEGADPPLIDVTGTWESPGSGFFAELSQTEDSVVGKTQGDQPAFIRGAWSHDRLVLIVSKASDSDGMCDRQIFVVANGGTPKALEGKWVSAQSWDRLVRTSGEGTDALEYPYDEELKACGDLVAYDLSFDSRSDALEGSEWPVLSAVTDLLRKDPRLKIRVISHTTPSGDAEKDYALSVNWAKAVKKKLIEKYHVEAKRVFAEGIGAEEPLGDNATALGRAVNSRIEIVAEWGCQRAAEEITVDQIEPEVCGGGSAATLVTATLLGSVSSASLVSSDAPSLLAGMGISLFLP